MAAADGVDDVPGRDRRAPEESLRYHDQHRPERRVLEEHDPEHVVGPLPSRKFRPTATYLASSKVGFDRRGDGQEDQEQDRGYGQDER